VGEAIARTRATHVSLVATQLHRLLGSHTGNGSEGVETVRAMLLGGSAIPGPLLDEAVKRGWPVHTTYGCTEMASQITTTPPGASREVLRTAGRCLLHRRLAVRDGRIRVGGKTLCLGYLRPDGSVRDVRGGDETYATGDLGWIDDDGYLHVTGRADRLIISGGENVQPEEVEAALTRLPGIARAFVVRVPDDEYGQRPVAFVDADDVDGPALREALREHLPGFKIPDAVYPLPGEAVSGPMKVDYDLLRRTARKLRSCITDRPS
jgi:O-succinylbenzoic acid--CoA ligase